MFQQFRRAFPSTAVNNNRQQAPDDTAFRCRRRSAASHRKRSRPARRDFQPAILFACALRSSERVGIAYPEESAGDIYLPTVKAGEGLF